VRCSGRMTFRVCGRERSSPVFGYVPQRLSVDADTPTSVLDLVAASIVARPVWSGVTGCSRTRALEALHPFGAAHLAAKRLGTLSGGELQRVLLGIAMNPVPQILLLDEPGTGVDPTGLTLFYEQVSALRRAHDMSVVLVTHDIHGIVAFADRMIFLDRTVVAEGLPREVVRRPELIAAFGRGHL
jgi:zinc transport system ATP-binding protein